MTGADHGDYGSLTEREHVFRCEHGEPIATRFPSGTWVGHAVCLRCRFTKWLKIARWRLHV